MYCRPMMLLGREILTRGKCAGEDSAGPPYALLEHAPLAVLTNGLLAAFNELRHCAPLSLCSSVAAILQVGA